MLRLEAKYGFERKRSLAFSNSFERKGSFWGRKSDIGCSSFTYKLDQLDIGIHLKWSRGRFTHVSRIKTSFLKNLMKNVEIFTTSKNHKKNGRPWAGE